MQRIVLCSLFSVMCLIQTSSLSAPTETIDVAPCNFEGFHLKEVINVIVLQASQQNRLNELPRAVLVCQKKLSGRTTKLSPKHINAVLPIIVHKMLGIQLYEFETYAADGTKHIDTKNPCVIAAACEPMSILVAIARLRRYASVP